MAALLEIGDDTFAKIRVSAGFPAPVMIGEGDRCRRWKKADILPFYFTLIPVNSFPCESNRHRYIFPAVGKKQFLIKKTELLFLGVLCLSSFSSINNKINRYH